MPRFFILLLITGISITSFAQAEQTLVFAAASLKPALDEILASAPKSFGKVEVSYAASSQLARQIEHGAPAAIFICADQDWMDAIDKQGLLAADTRTDLLGNVLVLVALKTNSLTLKITPGFDLLKALGVDGRLAIAEPNSVPAGKYAKAALSALGVWDNVSSRLATTDNVRSALNFVLRGETPLGIVYRSDAVSEPAVRIVDTFPDSSHSSIVYPIAVIKEHDSPAARQVMDLLRGSVAQFIFRRYGFDAPPIP